jgi:hypothetical protein
MASNLHIEVEKLRAWLATNRWVDQYDGWWSTGGVVSALQEFLADVPAADWSVDDVTDVLYILEQSSTDYIAGLVTQSESMALEVAKHSLERSGIAGDDIAEQLAHCSDRRDEAEALLLKFSQSDHERTRRMALLSLAALESAAVPTLAVAAWKTGDEYQRMGALSALKTVGSDLFPIYLTLAEQDGREHLVSLSRKYNDELTQELGKQR